MCALIPNIIPTRFKSKIAHDLSFPVGAEKISTSLADASQFDKLVLHFNSDRWNMVRRGDYPILRVSYSSRRAAMATTAAAEGRLPFWSEWQIEVCPVPRVDRHRIQQYILEVALPQVKAWLAQRGSPQHVGEEALLFFYDSSKEELSSETDFSPQPMRE